MCLSSAYLVTTAKIFATRLGGRRKAGYMNISQNTSFFLGANSKDGFYSLYDKFIDIKSGDYLWLIKGGAGCGKSSFMQYIGEAASARGFAVAYIHCSADPDSIDGIYIPEKKQAYIDASSPHNLDSYIPAAGDSYLNLGSFYNREKLLPYLPKLISLTEAYKSANLQASGLLSAAHNVDPRFISGLITEPEIETAKRRALGVAEREFGRATKQGEGGQYHRLISSICAKGRVRLCESITALCTKVYSLDDDLALADTYMKTLAEGAKLRSIDSIICHDPLDPLRIEALILPELSLGFIATRAGFPDAPNVCRNIRLDAIIDKNRAQSYRHSIKIAKRLQASLIDEAIVALSNAKAIHEEMEDIYNPNVDFDGLYNLADAHIKDMLRK